MAEPDEDPITPDSAAGGRIVKGPWADMGGQNRGLCASRKAVAICLIAGLFLLAEVAGIVIEVIQSRTAETIKAESADPAVLAKRNKALRKKLTALKPKDVHIIVDTARNMLYLKKGGALIRQAVVSCGSGNVLTDPRGDRTWVFDTPRGEFKIKSKVADPTWIRPDWAFIEEGESIPKKYAERAEENVLGDYAMGFGNGFFIHGTLYTRLLGRNVTHGCIRVGDNDLEAIFNKTPMGARLVIF